MLLLGKLLLFLQGRREGGAEGVICPRASDIQGPPMLVVNAPMVRGGGLYPTVMPRASICLSAALSFCCAARYFPSYFIPGKTRVCGVVPDRTDKIFHPLPMFSVPLIRNDLRSVFVGLRDLISVI